MAINGSGADYVSYAWHDVEGYSKFGITKEMEIMMDHLSIQDLDLL